MAKVLEALERARQERLKKMEGSLEPEAQIQAPMQPSALAPSAGEGEAPSTTRVDASRAPSVSAALQRKEALRPASDIIVGFHEENSPVTEQIRHIRSNMDSVLADYRTRTIAVTSPVSGDGKTVITANLACVLADSPDQKVVLIDADMRKPDQHHLLGVPAGPGLSEYLQGQCELSEAMYATCIPNLTVIPAGRTPKKPTVLLGSERMHMMISGLQRTYQWIVFDTPPLLPVTDATIIGRECLGTILVVRMGQTPRTVIERAQTLLAEMRLPVLGCILNDFSQRSRENQYYYSYYHKTHPEEQDGFKQ